MPMQNPHAARIGLDASGIAVDAGHHIVPESQYGSRLPGSYSDQIELPLDRLIQQYFSLGHIDSFPEQAIRVSDQNSCGKFPVSDLSKAGGGYQIGASQEGERMNYLVSLHHQFRGLNIGLQTPGHAACRQSEVQPCADQSTLRTLVVLTEHIP